jgi:hypothetical protein
MKLDSKIILEYFHLTFFALRIFIVKELSISLLETNIEENLNIYHDWFAQLKRSNTIEVKSNTYKLQKSATEICNKMNEK